MGRGQSAQASNAGVAVSRRSTAKAFPMNSILEAVAERLTEIDEGIFCSDCQPEQAYPVAGGDISARSLVGECPVHGRFFVDVTNEYEDELSEQVEDRPYQAQNV